MSSSFLGGQEEVTSVEKERGKNKELFYLFANKILMEYHQFP